MTDQPEQPSQGPSQSPLQGPSQGPWQGPSQPGRPQGAPQPPPPGHHPAAPPPYGSYPAPYVAPMSPEDQRLWATLAHLSGLVFHLIGTLVVYLVVKDRGAFVRSQAAEALNFWITVDIGLLISFAMIFVLIGFVGLVVIGVAAVVLSVVAAIAANRGEDYRYPINLRVVS
jgi:uncharacterized protein